MERWSKEISSTLSFALWALALLAGCGNDGGKKPQQVVSQPSKQGGRGESCLARNDCKENLVCIDNTCIRKNYNISKTAKSCEVIECTSNADCCQNTSPQCDSLQQLCNNQGDIEACQEFRLQCCSSTCNGNGTCVPAPIPCDPSAGVEGADCPSPDSTCQNGECVLSCEDNNDDCPDGLVCDQGRCQPGCETDADCSLPSATCQQNECVDRGCQTDRQCVLLLSDGDAVCGSDGECRVPCDYDAECNQDENNFEICQDGSCVFVGCQNNAECRAYLGNRIGLDTQAVCRASPQGGRSGGGAGSSSPSSGQ